MIGRKGGQAAMQSGTASGIKTIAMYLPQYHRVKENDAWWGEGFTEWTAVRAAKPLFLGHAEPRRPLGGRYYDLLDKETFRWQAGLMRKYLVSGLCFYHYWFKDGRQILEKPAENLLGWADIEMPYCFCWANSSWARSWNNIGTWSWSPLFDPARERDAYDVQAAEGILLQQKYGDVQEWEKHFAYLLPFFRDRRYLKANGKPLFLFYGPDGIPCLERMSIYWRQLAKANGLPGIYLVGINMRYPNPAMDACLVLYNGGRESIGNLEQRIKGTSLHAVDYDAMWQKCLGRERMAGMRTYWCGTVDYDDTPRRGRTGTLYLDATAEKFCRYFEELVQKSLKDGNEWVFLNAWNEWGEGMYLEPDELRGYKMLESVAYVMRKYAEVEPSRAGKCIAEDGSATWEQRRANKSAKMQELYHHWLLLKERGGSIVPWLAKRGYREVAVYGMGEVGRHIWAELSASSIKIKYIIDRSKKEVHFTVPIYDLRDALPKCDAVIVSVVDEYWEIARSLEGKVDCPVISLAEIVGES